MLTANQAKVLSLETPLNKLYYKIEQEIRSNANNGKRDLEFTLNMTM